MGKLVGDMYAWFLLAEVVRIGIGVGKRVNWSGGQCRPIGIDCGDTLVFLVRPGVFALWLVALLCHVPVYLAGIGFGIAVIVLRINGTR